MKIYAARKTFLSTIQQFIGKDLWVQFDMQRLSYEHGWYIKIVSINYDLINYYIAIDNITLGGITQGWRIPQYSKSILLDFEDKKLHTESLDKFKRAYKLHTPIEVYSTEELQEVISGAEVEY
jgi:hypothetical protein